MTRNRIYSVIPGKLTDDKRQELAGLLAGIGYAVRIMSIKTAKGVSRPCVEYWVEEEEKPAAGAPE